MAKCPFCESDLSDSAKKCRHCGEWVTSSPSDSKPERREGSVGAGIASLFIPGLGQFLTGRPKAGVGYFLVAWAAWLFLLGWIVHFVAAYDAGVGGVDSIERLKRLNEFKSPWSD